MHDFISGFTTYGIGIFAFLFAQDLTTYAAVGGLLLVLVRIAGDVPKAIQSWRDLLANDKDNTHGSDD